MEAVGVGRRAVAIIIDMILLGIIGYVIASFTGGTTREGFEVTGAPAFLLFLIAMAYYVVMEVKWGGTIGKLVLKLKVVKDGGEPIDWQASIIRNLLRIVDGFFFYLVGAIIVWTSKKRQRLGDMVAHTLVVPRIVVLVAALAAAGFHAPSADAAAPRYTGITISDSKGGKDTRTFKTSTAKVYVHSKIVDAPSGTKAKAEWIAVDTKGAAPPNYKIDVSELTAGPQMDIVNFSMSKPTAGWPVGDYRVDLFLDGKKASDVKFKVAK